MSDKTFVPYDGAEPSKRMAKQAKREAMHDKARDLLRSDNLVQFRAMSGLDNKAVELGIYSKEFHKLSRTKRSSLVAKALSKKHSA
jgi:stress-induced morphogen